MQATRFQFIRGTRGALIITYTIWGVPYDPIMGSSYSALYYCAQAQELCRSQAKQRCEAAQEELRGGDRRFRKTSGFGDCELRFCYDISGFEALFQVSRLPGCSSSTEVASLAFSFRAAFRRQRPSTAGREVQMAQLKRSIADVRAKWAQQKNLYEDAAWPFLPSQTYLQFPLPKLLLIDPTDAAGCAHGQEPLLKELSRVPRRNQRDEEEVQGPGILQGAQRVVLQIL